MVSWGSDNVSLLLLQLTSAGVWQESVGVQLCLVGSDWLQQRQPNVRNEHVSIGNDMGQWYWVSYERQWQHQMYYSHGTTSSEMLQHCAHVKIAGSHAALGKGTCLAACLP
uniref:Uncharacterized protein n=1 Tax=Eutreptiella gymnastica TaxID=73025 RepID=A0A7S1ID62_9EUGL